MINCYIMPVVMDLSFHPPARAAHSPGLSAPHCSHTALGLTGIGYRLREKNGLLR